MKQISVIIPVYNAEKYLDKCIQSVLEQSYQDFEIILVNDGSQDASGEICDKYAKECEQITTVHTDNCGPAAARKKGVDCAEGEYITFVDADDWLDREMLEFAVQKAQDKHADFICLGHKEVDENGKTKTISSQEFEESDLSDTTQMMLHLHGTRWIDSGPWAKLIRRSLFEDVDFCENVTIGEDYFMVLQLLEKADNVILCKEPMYNRFIRTTSISRSGYSERHKQAFEQYMKWRMYLLERYPELKTEITSYHMEYEMAVITAMCRNKKYDKDVIKKLVKDLRNNQKIILQCKKTPFYMRVSAVMIAYCYPLFIVMFRVVHILTGR